MRLPHALRELQRPTIRGLLVALISASFAFSPRHIHAADFRVNSPADVADANPGDGFCETAFGNGVCTLRAAIMETNALTGADTIELQGDATYYLSAGVLPISDSVAITGGGPDGTIIDGNGRYEILSLTGSRGGGICGQARHAPGRQFAHGPGAGVPRACLAVGFVGTSACVTAARGPHPGFRGRRDAARSRSFAGRSDDRRFCQRRAGEIAAGPFSRAAADRDARGA